MSRDVNVLAVQAAPRAIGSDLTAFRDEVVGNAAGHTLVVYPELHLFGWEQWPEDETVQRLNDSAVPLDGSFVAELGEIARAANTWLVPGSICERGPGGELFNTALAFSPHGQLVAHYRKVFPWRPLEPYHPGDMFVVFDLDGIGVVGLSICYDAWFPEVTRHLAWMGADLVVNIVKTTTPDRAQEVIIARANSIVNQTFTVSVNCAGPIGMGQSLIVDPEGAVLAASNDPEPRNLAVSLDLEHVARVREHGTAGCARMWSQFLPTDSPLELPLYNGRIDPARWNPNQV